MTRFYTALGRFDVRWRFVIVPFWIVVTILCVRGLPGLGDVAKDTQSGFLPTNSPSQHAADLAAPFQRSDLAASVLLASRSDGPLTTSDAAATQRLEDGITAYGKSSGLQIVLRDLGQSKDGEARQFLLQANVPPYGGGTGDTLVNTIRGDFTTVDAPAGLTFNLAGQLATATDARAQSTKSQGTTQQLSILFIIVFLFIAFRSLLAPFLTLFPAVLVLVLAGPVIAEISKATNGGVPVSSITQLILIVLVLGAGTDYGLFLVFRAREEIRGGLSPKDAVVRSVATVGESITFSGLIVIGALISLLIAQFGFYQGLGPALAIGIALMLLAALTLLPALLAIFGRAVFWPSRLHDYKPRFGWWRSIATVVVRHPAVTATLGVILFVALAAGQLGTNVAGFADQTAGPPGTDSAAGAAVLTQHFPAAGPAPTAVLFHFPHSVWDRPADLTDLQDGLGHTGDFSAISGPLNPNGIPVTLDQLVQAHTLLGPAQALTPTPPTSVGTDPLKIGEYQLYRSTAQLISTDGQTVQFSVFPNSGAPGSTAAINAVPATRDAITTVAHTAGADDNGIFSITAFAYDIQQISNNDLAHIIPTVAVVIGLLLAIVLRSLVAPLYLVISVVLSYLASLGLVAVIFVRLGGQAGVQFVLPFLMFVFLMALGSDYNVLIMTRIREEAHRLPLRDAVRHAVAATGTTITTAGLVLGGTFAVLAIGGGGGPSGGEIQQIGYGVAAGILMDTFLVRTIIIPSAVVLVGRWNWWPSKLSSNAEPDEAAAA